MKGDDFYCLSLTNPKGETKALTYLGWISFKWEVTRFSLFLSWAKVRGVSGSYIHLGKLRPNDVAIEEFLKSIGYSWVYDNTLGF